MLDSAICQSHSHWQPAIWLVSLHDRLVYPSIHFRLLILFGVMDKLEPVQPHPWAKRHGTPWNGHQSITRYMRYRQAIHFNIQIHTYGQFKVFTERELHVLESGSTPQESKQAQHEHAKSTQKGGGRFKCRSFEWEASMLTTILLPYKPNEYNKIN